MKRKNKSVRNSARSQPLPTTANAGEVAFARGISRRVVVVDAAESPLFEQIIYIVRDDAAGGGVTAADLVQQAREAVGCVPAVRAPRPKQRSYTGLLIGLLRLRWRRPSDTACTAAGERPVFSMPRRDAAPPGRFLRK